MVSLWQWLREDWQQFRLSRQHWPVPEPGLYTYHMQLPGGQLRRVHLRLDRDTGGVLFVDVTDVVHLNSTAAELTLWALDGIPQREAALRWRRRCGGHWPAELQRDLQAVYAMVDRLADPQLGCATCSLGPVDRQPLFSTRVHAPYKADLAITYQCNNDCPHCYNEADRLSLRALPVEDWQRVIDKLHAVGVPHLIFTGGEATLYRELPDLIAHANRLGPICGLNTNGRRLAHADYARRLANAGLNHVQITLGSHRAEVHDRMVNTHCFEQTVAGIRQAQAAGLHTITNTTLMRMNAEEIEQTIDFLKLLGIRTFAVNGMIYSGGGYDTGQAIREEELPPLLIRIRDRADDLGMKFLWYTPTMYCRLSPVELEIGAKRCNAGEYSLCVEPNADVLPCQSYYVAAGNLLRDPWDSIWHSQLFRSFRDRELDPQGCGLPEMCWECPDLPLCGGGCRIEREATAAARLAGSGGSSGGCDSGVCSSGGCGASRCHPLEADLPGPSTGFVSWDSLQLSHSAARRRGTGVFA
jgi:radical SAM protein with 4Fe4S-binding SPASM domain